MNWFGPMEDEAYQNVGPFRLRLRRKEASMGMVDL